MSTCWLGWGLAGSRPSSCEPVRHLYPLEQFCENMFQLPVHMYVHFPGEELEELEPFIRMPFGGWRMPGGAPRQHTHAGVVERNSHLPSSDTNMMYGG